MNIVFLGTPRLAQIVLENLIASDFKPNLVVTAPDVKAGRGQTLQMSPVKQAALRKNIAVSSQLSALSKNIDLAILVAYGQIIPKQILDIPKYGFLNVHPSLLPKYRGPSPIQSAILKGDKTTGVTIIKLDEELDHGPILAQKEIAIEKTDTHLSLIEKLGLIGSNLLLEILPKYLAHLRGVTGQKFDLTSGVSQDHSKATYTKKITKADGNIDPLNPPDPLALDRMIRAYYPWPSVWTKLSVNGSRQRRGSPEAAQYTVKLLPNKMIQPEGKNPMTFEDFKNGNPKLAQSLDKIF